MQSNDATIMGTSTMHREDDGQLAHYAWPGGYAVCYLMADGESICAECANGGNGSQAMIGHEACEERHGFRTSDQWEIVAQYVNLEGPDEYCAHCGKVMPSEYGDPDAKEED